MTIYDQNVTDDAIAFMADLDRRFQRTSGLTDRRDYSIFYSRLQPARVMVLGIKPGGRRDGTHQLASQTFYEDWAHEYVDMDYRIAAVMRPALMKALGANSPDQLRGVPKSNCFFQRAVGTDDFASAEMRGHAALCAPFVADIVRFVGPDTVILEGRCARDIFVRHQCQDVREDNASRVTGMRRGALNSFFRRESAFVPILGRRIDLLTLGHPSQFGHLPDWQRAVDALTEALGHNFLPPFEAGAAVRHPAATPALENTEIPKFHFQAKRTTGTSPNEHSARAGSTAYTRDKRTFAPAAKPPGTFRYSPIHDFWQHLQRTGPIGADAFFDHLMSSGWQRPSRKPLTPLIVRIDLVSMVEHGFAEVLS